jgi:hypothetical protein
MGVGCWFIDHLVLYTSFIRIIRLKGLSHEIETN